MKIPNIVLIFLMRPKNLNSKKFKSKNMQKFPNKKTAKNILEDVGITPGKDTKVSETNFSGRKPITTRSSGSFVFTYNTPRGDTYTIELARYNMNSKSVHIINSIKDKIEDTINGKPCTYHRNDYYSIEGDDTHYTRSDVVKMFNGKPIGKKPRTDTISNEKNIPITKLDTLLFQDKFYALMPKNKNKKTGSYSEMDVNNFNAIANDLIEHDEAIHLKGLVLASGYTNEVNAVIYPVISENKEYGLRMKCFIAKVDDTEFYLDMTNTHKNKQAVKTEDTVDMSALEVEI